MIPLCTHAAGYLLAQQNRTPLLNSTTAKKDSFAVKAEVVCGSYKSYCKMNYGSIYVTLYMLFRALPDGVIGPCQSDLLEIYYGLRAMQKVYAYSAAER